MDLRVEGELPEGWTLLGTAAVVKCWDNKGEVKFCAMYSDSINDAEKRGMFDIGTERLTEDMAEEYLIGDKDDDDDD